MTIAPEPTVAVNATGLLAEFNRAGVLHAADVHVAQRLGRLRGERDEQVLLAAALVVRSTRQGSVMLPLADARRTAVLADTPEATAVAAALPWPEPTGWLAAVGSSPLVGADGRPPLRLEGGALWLDRYWRQEVAVAEDLLRRASDAPEVDLDRLGTVLSRLWPDTAPDDQRLAAAVCTLSRVSVLAGGPGTGKTTTVARLVAAFRELAEVGVPPRLALAAPTGKAAARMKEAMHEAAERDQTLVEADRDLLRQVPASTLHRLLRLGYRSPRYAYGPDNPLPLDVLVVDEASMISLTLFAKLLAALPSRAQLVIVGDPDQLTAVEAGAVLADLTAGAEEDSRRTATRAAELQVAVPHDVCADAPVAPESAAALVRNGIAFLRKVHRYADGGPIAGLAARIRTGGGTSALELLGSGVKELRFHEVADDGPLTGPPLAALRAEVVAHARTVIEAARDGDAARALVALERHRLMCAHRRGPRGVGYWDRLVERWVAEDVGVTARRDGRYAGLPLLVLENDYDNDLFNGDTGVVVDRGGDLVGVFGSPEDPVEVALGRLGAVVPMRALTVHRSQGSQFDRVTVVLPSPTSPLATREMLYTAVTRARSAVTVIGSTAAVLAAVAQPVARATGLRGRLAASEPPGSDQHL
ncbi:exodeoxyribonuclease V subunit alpha [Geodermatophilus sp. SYSU D01105]